MTARVSNRAADDLRPPHGRRLLVGLGLGIAVLVGLTVVGYRLASQGLAAETTTDPTEARPTAEVVRETIADTRSFGGTLGHGDPFPVRAWEPGIVTAVADYGIDVAQGTQLFRVDEQPVTALYGTVPAYRDLRFGDSGRDVAQLVASLTALGYTTARSPTALLDADCTTDDEFTRCVEEAVRAWQQDIGSEATGTVRRSDVVFVPEQTRVGGARVGVGDAVSPGSVVLDLTGVEQVVIVDVDVRHRDLLAVGTEVAVRLPGGAHASGTVTASRVVPADTAGADAAAIARVEVTLDDPVDSSYVGAPVDVVVEVGQRVDVLTVPVTALLALSGGGHGVEVVATDGTTSVVPVETGLFASGRVEVSGPEIDEGTVVVVAAR